MRNRFLAGTALAAVLALTSAAQAAETSPTIIRLMTSDVFVDASGLETRTQGIEIVATNEAAAMDVGQMSLPYRESMQELEIVEAYTLKANGQRLPVAANAIYTQQPQSSAQLQAFDDTRQKVIVFPNVAAGDSVVYTARWRDKIAPIPGHFTYGEFFRPTVTYDEARGSITAPKSLPLKIENHDVQVEKQETGDTVTYRWRYSAPANGTFDYPEVSPLDSLPRLLVSSLASHEELGRTYASLIAPKEAITPRIQALADQLTAGIADRRQQAQKIYDWVSKNIRYVAVDIGNGGIIPHEADVTLANGYGDCKDHVVLFGALLKAKGIASEVALINLGSAYTIPDVAMIMPFNHVITWLPDFQLYVDTTAGVAPFGTLPFAEYGKPVVHAIASGGAVRRTPVLPAGQATISLKTVAKLGEDGKVTGESTVTAAGPSAVRLRGIGLSIQATGPARFAVSALEEQGVKGTGTIDVPPPTELNPTYALSSRFEYTNSELVSGKGFGMIRGIWLTPVTGDSFMGSVFETPQKETDPTACFSGHAEEDLTLELPPGAPIGDLPRDFEVKTAALQFNARWSVAGRAITVRRAFTSTISQALCTGDVRKETARALDQIRNHYERTLISYAPVQPSADPGDPDVAAAVIAYDRRDYASAIQHATDALRKTDLAPALRTRMLSLRGDAHNTRGDGNQAVADYTELLRLNPDRSEVYGARGSVLASIQQYDQAIADYTEAIRLSPDVADYYTERGYVFSALRRFREAAEDYSAVIRLNPNDQLPYVSRAEAYEQEALYERVIADCSTAIRLGRNNSDCYVHRGFGHYALARYDQALADFNKASEVQPSEPWAFVNRALTYLATNQFEKARADFDTALRLQPNEPRALFGRAVAKERLGDGRGAELDLSAARRIDSNIALSMSGLGIVRGTYVQGKDDLDLCKAAVTSLDIYQGTIFCSRAVSANLSADEKSTAHVSVATLHRDRQHFEEAQRHYDEALRLTPNSARVYVERGGALRLNRDLDGAIQAYDRAIQIDPSFAEAYFGRAFAHRVAGRNQAAIDDYSQAIRFNPRYAGAFINRGNLQSEREQYAEAINDFSEAIKIEPNNPAPLSSRCFTLAIDGRAQDALADCNEALRLQPDFVSAFVSRGYANLRLQNFAAAISDYDSALAGNPNGAMSLYGRGVAKIRTGKSAEGNADITEAVKRDPEIALKMTKYGVRP